MYTMVIYEFKKDLKDMTQEELVKLITKLKNR